MVRIVPRHSHAVDSHLWEGYSADSSFFQFANRLSGDHGGDILRSPIVSDCVLIRVNILEHLQATSSAGIVERIAAEHPCRKVKQYCACSIATGKAWVGAVNLSRRCGHRFMSETNSL